MHDLEYLVSELGSNLNIISEEFELGIEEVNSRDWNLVMMNIVSGETVAKFGVFEAASNLSEKGRKLIYNHRDAAFKCITHGCGNFTDQGKFNGRLCNSCHNQTTTGKVTMGGTFFNELKDENEYLKNEILKLKND